MSEIGPWRVKSAQDVRALLTSYRFPHTTETELQEQIAQLFSRLFVKHAREVRLNDKDRPDFMVGTIAVEVKIAGSRANVMTQIHRYAQCPEISAIVLVTTKARHLEMPREFNGKPVLVASLLEGSF